jgi:hypothetical protein
MVQPPDANAETQFVLALANELRRKQVAQSRPTPSDHLPLCDQLNQWLNELPAPARQAPRTIPELQAIFKGKRGGPPSASEIGTLLRRAGWSRARQWAGYEKPFRRFWTPPKEQ